MDGGAESRGIKEVERKDCCKENFRWRAEERGKRTRFCGHFSNRFCNLLPNAPRRPERHVGKLFICGRLFGGPDRDRTDDLFHAMEARSQLRHRPTLRRGAVPILPGCTRFVNPCASSAALANVLFDRGLKLSLCGEDELDGIPSGAAATV
jgi:hypothetical protein